MQQVQQQLQIINLDALDKAPLQQEPFPYLVVDNLLYPEMLDGVVKSFPEMDKRGSFSLQDISCSGPCARLFEELQSPELKALIGERFGMDLRDNPSMITARGYTTERDGHIHIDSSSKLITVLVYLNPNWEAAGGRLRLLYNNRDLTPYAAEIPPEAGRCVIFKVTPNCWHGHEVFTGVRRSIQLNYVTSTEARERHLKRHRFSAFMKKLIFKKNDANSSY